MGGPAGLPGITPATILPYDPPEMFPPAEFGDRQTTKCYTQCRLETDGPPDVTHSMVWRPTPRQTLHTVWFGDPPAAKRYTY